MRREKVLALAFFILLGLLLIGPRPVCVSVGANAFGDMECAGHGWRWPWADK
jgi:hypothetical protein